MLSRKQSISHTVLRKPELCVNTQHMRSGEIGFSTERCCQVESASHSAPLASDTTG